jgi:hypothetical protein
MLLMNRRLVLKTYSLRFLLRIRGLGISGLLEEGGGTGQRGAVKLKERASFL